MPHENRLALLDLARRRDMVVVEDTYQTEIISPGKVTPSLKSLDREGRVIHIGSLSKSVAPGLLIMTTCFTRLIVVFSLVRSALGLQQTPPNMGLVSLAMFLTYLIMQPVFEQSWEDGLRPLIEGVARAMREVRAANL